MRGGAIPLAVWSGLIAVLFAVHWVWTGDTLQNASFGFALGVILAGGAAAAVRDREMLARGAPETRTCVETVTTSSLAAPLIAAAVVACGFGLVFGSFLVFIAAGMFVAGAGLAGRELTGERRARARETTQGQRSR